MCPRRAFPPVEYWLGVKPIQAANWRPFLNSRALPTVATMASAVVGPMPRIFIRRCAGSQSLADPFIERAQLLEQIADCAACEIRQPLGHDGRLAAHGD